MKWLMMICLPGMLCAQELRFEFQPEAFPVDICGWQPFCPWTGGMSWSAPEFVDIDGDGDLDLFVGHIYGTLFFFQNDGNASAPDYNLVTKKYAGIDLNTFTFGGYTCPRLRDLDADGDKDLLVSTFNGNIHYWENRGTPQQPSFVFITDSLENVYAPGYQYDLCDIDADGDLDLFMGTGLAGWIYFYRNDGTPQSWDFTFADNHFSGITVGGWAAPTFADIDADGDYDLFVGNEAGQVYYYRNDGTAQSWNFTLVTNDFLHLDVGGNAAPEFADIDGDSVLDFFCGLETDWSYNNQGDIFYYENVGTAQLFEFQYTTDCYTQIDEGVGGQPFWVDLDADGDQDLVIGSAETLRYYRNDNGTFVYVPDFFPSVYANDLSPYFVDLDADGDYDLFCGSSAIPGPPTLYLYRNDGTPQIPNFVLVSSNYLPNPDFFVLIFPFMCDIDADGDQDLFLSDQNYHFYLYENVGNASQPNFQLQTDTWQGIADTLVYGTFYDLDEDSDQDLFYEDPATWNLHYWENIGTPQQAQMVHITDSLLMGLEVGVPSAYPRFCDMDGDGDGDLFLGSLNGGVMYLKNTTGDSSAVGPPPVERHPRAGLQISLGPNPANPFVVASFELRVASNMSLDVFDLLGRRIAELASGFHLPGEYRYVWDASGKAAGMYFVRLKTGLETVGEKLLILK